MGFDRLFDDVQLDLLATPLSIRLERAAKAQDAEAANGIADEMDGETLAIYDAYLNWMGVLQGYIVRRAEKTGVPVIEGSNPERAIAELMELVLRSAERIVSRIAGKMLSPLTSNSASLPTEIGASVSASAARRNSGESTSRSVANS